MGILLGLSIAAASPVMHFSGVAVQPVGDSVYVESPATPHEVRAVANDVEAAYAKLRRAFDAPGFRAIVIVCRTPACKVALGASPGNAQASDLGFAATNLAAE